MSADRLTDADLDRITGAVEADNPALVPLDTRLMASGFTAEVIPYLVAEVRRLRDLEVKLRANAEIARAPRCPECGESAIYQALSQRQCLNDHWYPYDTPVPPATTPATSFHERMLAERMQNPEFRAAFAREKADLLAADPALRLWLVWAGGAGWWVVRAASQADAERIALTDPEQGAQVYNPANTEVDDIEELTLDGPAGVLGHNFT